MMETEIDGSLDGIAIVGMTGRFPGAAGIEEFWKNLQEGRETIKRFSREELSPSEAASARESGYVPARGVLDGADRFDPAFFGMTPNEARVTDPQQRVFLECAWEALESAGYDPARYDGAIGVYAGMSNNSYFPGAVAHRPDLIDAVGSLQTMMGNEKDYLATRVAYKLDLKGPAINVYTACSTSLVAVCQAVSSLLSYQCDLALAGGVSVVFPQERGYVYREGGITSPDGHCRAFDVAAQGTVFSSGVGIVVLKRLGEAIDDGDTIHAVIKGAALNNDGSGKVSFTAPSVDGHAEVIALAQALAGVLPRDISYIEAHGTATPLGDPIEIAGLTQAFRQGTDERAFCAIGSVKTNVGHLDAAAGVTGLIKTVLALKHRQIPPSLHFTAPNPKLDLENSPFVVNTRLTPWETNGAPRRAGVSSFGVGGTNAHVIVEEAPETTPGGPARRCQLLPVSAKSVEARAAAAERLADYLENHPDVPLADVAHTLSTGRHTFPYRRFVVASDAAEAATALREQSGKKVFAASLDGKGGLERPVTFLFPGQGVQHVDMGRELYESEPVFRDGIDACATTLQPILGLDLRTILYPAESAREEAQRRLTETWITQPALFVVEYALARLWESLGVRPAAMIGHSVGEYVAACLSGVFSLEDALTLLARRARLMQDTQGGAMLAVRLSEDELRPMIPPALSLAAVNAPALCVVSGPTADIERFESDLGAEKIASRRLATSHAFHSAMMEPILARFRELVAAVPMNAPSVPYISSLTGTFITPAEATDPDYWVRQLREAVRFSDGAAELLRDESRVYLEVGPGATLGALVRQRAGKEGVPVVASLTAPGVSSEVAALVTAFGQLWLSSASVDPGALTVGERRRRVSLPTYPFERESYILEPVAPEASTPVVPVALPEKQAEAKVELPPAPAVTALRTERLYAEVAAALRDLSGLPADALSPDAAFLDLGFDSLFLTQAAQQFQSRFGVRMTFRQLIENLPTVGDVAAYLDASLPPDPEPVAPAVKASEPTIPPAVDAAVAPPSNGSGAALTGATPLERVIEQQLQLMARQLEILRGEPATPGAPALIDGESQVKARVTSSMPASPANAAPVRAFGPYRPPERGASGEMTATQRAALESLIARYTERTAGSKRVTQENRGHLADPRAVAGFRQVWKEMVYPIVAERSDGARIWDVDGNAYIDLTLGFGTNLFGHRPPFVVEAIERQLARGFEIGPQSALAGQVAAKVCALTGMERAAFCCTGSEAVTAALRVTRTVTGRSKIALFSGAYHGQFDEALVRAVNRDGRPGALPVAPGIPAGMAENVLVLEYGAPESLEILREHGNELAAVLVEPIQSRRPDFQPEAFLHELRALTRECGAALVFDEVVTGFRVHPRGVQGLYGIEADLATYGKVVGGGLPIGIVTGKARFLDALDGGAWRYGDDSFPEVGVTFFAGTFVRHPLALAAADAVLDHLQANSPDLQTALDRRTERMVERLNALFEEAGAPLHLRRFSSFFMIDYPAEERLGGLFFYLLRLNGIHIWEGRPGFLSTAHTDGDVERIIDAFRESVTGMQRAGFLPVTSVEVAASTLTEAQREVWLAARMGDGASCALNESLSLELTGTLDADALERALNGVRDRHESLRTTFSPTDGTPTVAPAGEPIALECVDLSVVEPDDQMRLLAERAHAEGGIPFDLGAGPLLRATLVKLSEERHVLLLTAHHIVCDGWSFGVLLRDLAALYAAETGGAQAALASPPHFSEYARGIESGDEPYWLERLTPPPGSLELPADRPYPPARTYGGGRVSTPLSADLYDALKRLSSRQGSTLFTTLLAAFGAFLHRLTGQDDLIVGVPAAGQPIGEMPDLVGHCVHLLPIRLKREPEARFDEYLKQVRGTVLDAFDHPQVTFGSLLAKLPLERESGRPPLVGVTFNLDREDVPSSLGPLKLRVEKNARSYFQFDLGLNLVESDGVLTVEANYNGDILDEETVRRWLGHYRTLLEAMAAQPTIPTAALPLLSAAERSEMLTRWNDTSRTFPRNRAIHDLFAEQAARTPAAVAVSDGGDSLTYAELDRRANRLAHYLHGAGVAPGTAVAVCLERSPQLIVALLAVLKAGGAYVPLDCADPAERRRFVIEDSGATILLTDSSLARDIPPGAARVVSLDGEREAIDSSPETDPAAGANGESLAYIMYTSGSTGQPKGAEIPHRAVVRLAVNTDYVTLTPADVVGQAATVAFDAATFEIWGALLSGARLSILPRDVALSPRAFAERLREDGITVLFLTTALFNELARETPGVFGSLRCLLFGGEAVDPRRVREVLEAGPPTDLLHVYGPTETTTFASWHKVTAVPEGATTVPIGLPLAHTSIHLLDDALEPVPLGVAGEICIGGDGLARGYRNRPELTAERFVESPLAPGERLYRTGDRARRLPDGAIEFLGRRDEQIKIRGFRIEPGEIETILRRTPSVRDARVTAARTTGGDRYLLAYVVPVEGEPPSTRDLRDYLESRLPTYLIPSAFVLLDEFPLTPGGKVDRQALPIPEFSHLSNGAGEERTLPRNVTERLLAHAWRDILEVDEVGVHDDFFAIGGHSLLAVRLAARIEATFGQAFPLSTLFQAPTIARQSELLRAPEESTETASTPAFESLVPLRADGPRPRLFCVHHGYGDLTGYHDLVRHLGGDQPVYGLQARGLDGTQEPFDRIEDMAALYVSEIRTLQPGGPYHITGFSLGGVIAYEMARQLREAGQDVGLLALLDTYAPRFFQDARGEDGDTGLWSDILHTAATFTQVAPDKRWSFALSKGRAAGHRLRQFFDRGPHVSPEESRIADAIKRVEMAGRTALRRYQPPVYDGDAVIIRAQEREIVAEYDPVLWWREVIRGDVEVREVSGDHVAIIQEPGVAILSRYLRECMDAYSCRGKA